MVAPATTDQRERAIVRAKVNRVRVREVERAEYYTSKSQTGMGWYDLNRHPSGWSCTCWGYARTGACKHLGELERRAKREGWRFGTVAPRDEV
jgi:hypothetical protein